LGPADTFVAFTYTLEVGNYPLDNRTEEIGINVAEAWLESIRQAFDDDAKERRSAIVIDQLVDE
jgi:hypothetical protein